MDELLTRGVEAIYPSPEALAAVLKSGRRLKVYLGVDPTGPDLHLGHSVLLWKLREFGERGHQTILLIGDFTARVGDPSGKTAARPVLSPAQIKANLKRYRRQAGKILDWRKTQLRFNSRWLAKLKLAELLALAAEFTVSQFLERDLFAERQKAGAPIHLHEFFYPLLQGYDSVALGVDLELGGNDQTFNMLVGRTMLRRRGREKFVLATKLLVDSSGWKMGKSEGNVVPLDAPPGQMYGRVMSWPDNVLPLAAETLTRLPLDEFKNLAAAEPKAAKMRLARELVRLGQGDERAAAAEADFAAAFQKGKMPAAAARFAVPSGTLLLAALAAAPLGLSKTALRRFFASGAVHSLGTGAVLTDPDAAVTASLDLRLGKKKFLRLETENR